MIGETIAHYRILDRLGSGGMGEVFLAEDLKLHRQVALKMLPPGCDSERAQARLLHEARVASALNHPNIAIVYEINQVQRNDQAQYFIAMERVEGRTLTDLLHQAPLDLDRVIAIGRQIADALCEAHARGVVHRDVKSGNVMVTDSGRVKVLDFGLARYHPLTDDQTSTWSRGPSNPGALAGTVAYMSPEQARGLEVDARSDVFSMGVLLYELLTGRLPFTGGNAVEVFDAILREPPPPIPGDAPRLRALERVLGKMLAKDRNQRHQSMGEVGRDLQRVARGDDVPPPVPALPTVAVMSFVNITRSSEDDWLGTGIAETVTADLKGLEGVSVIGRERVFEVLRKLGGDRPGDDPGLAITLGRELGARFVLSGGYQRIGDLVRVTARLLAVDTGEVARTVKLDGTVSEIFALQDRIVGELVSGLRLTLAASPHDGDDTHVVEAYEAYAKGVVNLRAENQGSLERAIAFFERAIDRDPTYARAHLQLGVAYDLKATYLVVPELFERAASSFRRAIDLRPTSTEAWRELGSTLIATGRETEGMAAIERALALDPTEAANHSALGRAYFVGQGRFGEAAACYERALALNPQGGWSALQLAHCCAFLRDFERGESAARSAVVLQEGFLSGRQGAIIIGANMRLGYLLALQGRYTEALAEYERELRFLARIDHALKERTFIELQQKIGSALRRLGRRDESDAAFDQALGGFERRLGLGADEPFTRYYIACVHAVRGEADAALDDLERCVRTRRAFTLERARLEPDLEGVRSHARFEALLRA